MLSELMLVSLQDKHLSNGASLNKPNRKWLYRGNCLFASPSFSFFIARWSFVSLIMNRT